MGVFDDLVPETPGRGGAFDDLVPDRPGAGRFARPKTQDGGGFVNQFVGNIPTGIAGTLDTAEMVLPPQIIAGLARRALGVPSPKEQWESSPFAPSKPVTSEEKLGATLGDFVGGSVVPGAGWIGGARSIAAVPAREGMNWLGQFARRAAEETAKHPYKAAGFDLASSLTGGTAKHSAEEAGYGPVGQSVAALAGGLVPAAPSLIGATPIGTFGRYITGRGQGARNAIEAQQELWNEAGVRQFGPAMVDNPIYKATGQGGAGSVFGGPLRSEAQGSIDDTLGQARRVMARGTDGAPINDVGQGLQEDLRRALLERSRTVKGLPKEELEKITGPVGSDGFMPPRPVVDPVEPRVPPPVRPETIDPAMVDIPPVQPREIPKPVRNNNYTRFEDIPVSPEYQRPIQETQRGVKEMEAELSRLKTAFDERVKSLNRQPAEVFQEIDAMAQKGNKTHMLNDDYQRITQTWEELSARRQRLNELQTLAEQERDAAWSIRLLQEDSGHAAQFKRDQAQYEAQLAQARKEAEDETRRLRTIELQRLQRDAEEAAIAKQKAAEERVRQEAQDATLRLQDQANQGWEREVANGPGFRAGRSRESYPTEFDAAYERVRAETPRLQRNPLGGGGASGSPYKTSTEQLMDQFGLQGRQQGLVPGYKEGQPFGPAAGWAYEVGPYIDELVGKDVGRRLDAYARLRAEKKMAPGVDGLRDFRTAVREAAQAAENPPFPGTPRTREAAALRRLEQAVTEDMYRFMGDAGPQGERAAQMWKNVDRQYRDYITELRKPLAKIFGDNVKPVEAMDRITKAAVDGDLKTLRAFMRVMDEKADPHKATAAIFANLTDNAPTLQKFLEGVNKLHPDALKVLTKGDAATAMIRDLQRLQGIASRLEPYEKAMNGGVRFAGRGPDLSNPANIALGITMVSNVFASVLAVGGAAAVSRFMASPKYLTWMTQTAKLQRQPQITAHVARLSRMVQQDEEKGWLSPKTGEAIRQSMSMGAHAMTTGNQDTHPYQGVFDAAKSKGVDYQKADPKDVMDAAWEASPTDAMGEMLDAMSKSLGIPPPWERKK